MLTIGVHGRNGRGGSAHSVLLKQEGALQLLQDLADTLGFDLVPAAQCGSRIPAQRVEPVGAQHAGPLDRRQLPTSHALSANLPETSCPITDSTLRA
jgi:hypothetical protein